jgi:precorrin-6A/cobalt-precorrin-6A reductase
MILLLGGTTEATSIAKALVEAGYEVLLSTSTSIPSRGLGGIRIRQRNGELDNQGLVDLIRAQGIRIVVDATHPYAEAISANAWAACQQTGIVYVAFDRPSAVEDAPDIHWASDHDEAATLACLFGQPVLLTIGVRNLTIYVAAARLHGIKLVARILDHPSSVEACRRMGLSAEETVCANGPFSVTENALLIARHRIGTLVTKDSGDIGGVGNKIVAARSSGCRIVVVKRPLRPQAGYSSISALMEAIRICPTTPPFFLDSRNEIS